MSHRTSKDDENRPPKTQLDKASPGNETVLDAQGRPLKKTTLDENHAGPSDSGGEPRSSLQLLPSALAAEFTLTEPLATKGAEADLFIVERRTDGKSFVAKIYRQGISVKTDLLDLVVKADPEHVVRVVDHGQSDGRHYELQEYVALGSMVELIEEEGPRLKPGLAKEILHELLIAIRHLHEKGITHRDLKPANILVRTRKPLDLVLTDFGISSLMHNESVRFSTGDRTISYSAPESDSGMVTQASDYWSLGMMLAEIVGGEHPYAGLSNQVISGAKATKPVPLAEVEEPWLKLCRGLLIRDPEKRWGAEYVERWLAGDKSLPEPTVQWSRSTDIHVVRPCHFHGKEYQSAEALAVGFAKHWNDGFKYLERGHLHKWLNDELGNQELTVFIEDLDLDSSLDGHAKLFRVIQKMNPEIPPSFREVGLTVENLEALARRALTEDTPAQDVLTSLMTGNIISELEDSPRNHGLIATDRKWRQAEKEYASLKSETQENGPSQRQDEFQTQAVRLGILLLGVLDQEFVGDFRKQTRGIATDKAREVQWYADLGDPNKADPPALLLMQETMKTAEQAAERQREALRRQQEKEEQERQVEKQKKKERAKARAVKINLGIAHGLMVVVPVVIGYLNYPKWVASLDSLDGADFIPMWLIIAAPAFVVFAGYLAAELWSVLTCEKSAGGDAFWRAFSACLFSPIYAGIGGGILYLILLLIYSVFDIQKGAGNLLEISYGVSLLVLWGVVGMFRLIGDE